MAPRTVPFEIPHDVPRIDTLQQHDNSYKYMAGYHVFLFKYRILTAFPRCTTNTETTTRELDCGTTPSPEFFATAGDHDEFFFLKKKTRRADYIHISQ